MKRVLLVDDDPDILESVGLLLELEGFNVTTVADAAGIIPALEASRPHVVLQDVNMPDLDIRAIVARIKSVPGEPRPLVVLFSAALDLDDIAETSGADGLVRKPFAAEDLLTVLGTVS